jgi:hypothetical protein
MFTSLHMRYNEFWFTVVLDTLMDTPLLRNTLELMAICTALY